MNEYEDNSGDGESFNGPEESGEPSGSIWDNDDAIEAIKMERAVNPDETNEDMAKRLFQESIAPVAQSMIHIALHSQNDNTRLNAGKFITEFVLGEKASGAKAKWEELVGEAVSEAELHANQGSS
jgi:hypothetical protein